MNHTQEIVGLISFIVFVVGIIAITLSLAYAVAWVVMKVFGL